MAENRQVVIASLPAGPLAGGHYALRSSEVPVPSDGEVLVRTLLLTIGAGQRAYLQGSAGYRAGPKSGLLMDGTGVGRVEVSKVDGVSPGDLVVGETGWQDYAILSSSAIRPIDADIDPAQHLSTLGTNGLTAYFGIVDVGQPARR